MNGPFLGCIHKIIWSTCKEVVVLYWHVAIVVQNVDLFAVIAWIKKQQQQQQPKTLICKTKNL